MKSTLLVAFLGLIGLCAAQQAIELSTLVTGNLPAGNSLKCYQMTLSDSVVKQVVWWEAGKILLRLEPCSGRPHMKVSVYGCPSQTKTVYEFMSDKMKNDAIANGAQASIPKDWEWPGDVETLTIDITHKTYYIEISNLVGKDGSQVASSYQLYTDKFDSNSTVAGAPKSKEDIFPLKYMDRAIWDRKVARDNGSDTTSSFSFGGGSSANIVTINFFPPGLPGNAATSAAILATKYEYAFFIREITDSIGTSKGGPFVSQVAGLCPSTGDACTEKNCRSCANDYPRCPKEFLTSCDETTLNVETLKKELNASSTTVLPFDAYVKNPANWTAWTVCGAKSTMDQVDSTMAYVLDKKGQPPVFFPQAGPEITRNGINQNKLSISGLKDTNNNVYLVNIVVRKAAGTASSSNSTSEEAVYEFMTLQMRTPRYETPKLNSTDYAVIIGVSVGLGVCIFIFIIVAIFVRQKRKKKLAQRIRMKK